MVQSRAFRRRFSRPSGARRSYGGRYSGRKRSLGGRGRSSFRRAPFSRPRLAARRLTRTAIFNALMPKMILRQQTSQDLCSGVVRASRTNADAGTASTNMYGFAEHVYLDNDDLSQIRVVATAEFPLPAIQNLPGGAGSGLAQVTESRISVSTMANVHMTSTCGTTCYIEWWLCEALFDGDGAVSFPVNNSLANQMPQGKGSALVSAAWQWRLGAVTSWTGLNSTRPINVTDIDTNWTQAPGWSRYFKIKNHRKFTLEHGRSLSFNFKLPKVTFSSEELRANPVATSGTAFPFMRKKCFFSVFRICGVAGVVNEGAPEPPLAGSQDTISIASAACITTRRYKVQVHPMFSSPSRSAFLGELPVSGNQVWVNNQYGQGLNLQPAYVA